MAVGKRKKKKEAYFTKYTINSKVSRDSFKEVQKNLQKKDKKLRKILKDFQLGFQFPVYFQKLWTA